MATDYPVWSPGLGTPPSDDCRPVHVATLQLAPTPTNLVDLTPLRVPGGYLRAGDDTTIAKG